jgi:hypothetical protein
VKHEKAGQVNYDYSVNQIVHSNPFLTVIDALQNSEILLSLGIVGK